MNIPKAKEVLRDIAAGGPHWPPDYRRAACNLGIQALQAVEQNRSNPHKPVPKYLQGEKEANPVDRSST